MKATLAANLKFRYFLRICNGGCDISLRMPLRAGTEGTDCYSECTVVYDF